MENEMDASLLPGKVAAEGWKMIVEGDPHGVPTASECLKWKCK
jgi:hypothetical protein